MSHNQCDCSFHAFDPAETASLSWWARLRAISLGDSSSWSIHFIAACPSAVADSAAPINHKKKPTQSNTTPELIRLRLTTNAGREVELLIIVLISERVTDPRVGSHHAHARAGKASPRPGES